MQNLDNEGGLCQISFLPTFTPKFNWGWVQQCFTSALFVQNFGVQNYKAVFWVYIFWCQNISKKVKCWWNLSYNLLITYNLGYFRLKDFLVEIILCNSNLQDVVNSKNNQKSELMPCKTGKFLLRLCQNNYGNWQL